ncbi:MAG: FAD binding domain-containing protein [Candidatus Promineifilaceae bacterium]
MYPAKFEYVRAGSVEEAIALLGDNEDAKLLAGGHSLIPVMKLRLAQPEMLIDIGRIDGIKGICAGDGMVAIGALTTHSEVESSSELPAILPEAAAMIGDPSVRNRGTVGGNVAHADPASDLPTVFLALGASFNITGADGSRSVAADDFFIGLFETALGEGEVLTSVEISAEGENTGSGYAKLFNPASRYAMVGAAATVTMENGSISSANVAIGGLTAVATRCASVSAALVGTSGDEAAIAAAAAAVADDLGEVIGDMHASADYRRAVAPEMVKRAISKAVSRAG